MVKVFMRETGGGLEVSASSTASAFPLARCSGSSVLSSRQRQREPGCGFCCVGVTPHALKSASGSRGRRAVVAPKLSEDKPVVFVVDDDAPMRRALESLLKSVGHEVRLFASAPEFMQTTRADAPGCLILDVRLPGMSGLAFQQELAKAGVTLPIIFITGHGDVPMSVRAMKAGAAEFLIKPFDDQVLLDAVHAALERDRARRRDDASLATLKAHYDGLTDRERQVMGHVAAGWMNKRIAAELSLSVVTVKVHRGQVMRKMQAKSVAELVRMADRLGLPRADTYTKV